MGGDTADRRIRTPKVFARPREDLTAQPGVADALHTRLLLRTGRDDDRRVA